MGASDGPGPARMPALDRVDVVVPVRSLAGGKARLGGAIDAEEREGLILGMLRRTLGILADWPGADRIHVVSTDPRVVSVARDAGADALLQDGEGLNAALLIGRRATQDQGAAAVLILPADLPLLTTTSLEGMLEAADAALAAGGGRPVVVVAAADARGGTNGLLLAPPDVIEPCFGPSSFEAHVRAAAAAEATLQVVTDAGLGFDLDTPEDLELLPAVTVEELLDLGRDAVATPGV